MNYKGTAHKVGEHIDTDAIIPARFLVTSDAKELGANCMAGLEPDWVKRVKPGDIIVEVDGEIVSTMTALQNKLKTYNEGDTITVKVFRDDGLAEQAGQNRIDLSKIGEGEYVDLSITLRVIDNLNM